MRLALEEARNALTSLVARFGQVAYAHLAASDDHAERFHPVSGLAGWFSSGQGHPIPARAGATIREMTTSADGLWANERVH